MLWHYAFGKPRDSLDVTVGHPGGDRPAQLLQSNSGESRQDFIEPDLLGRRQDLDELILDPPIRHIDFVGVEDAEQLVAAEPEHAVAPTGLLRDDELL